MTRKIELSNLDHLVQMYRVGATLEDIAEHLGVSTNTVWRRFRQHGVDTARRMPIPDLDALIEAYRGGESMKSIADRTGISRTVLTPRFRERGVQVRGRSEAEILKWREMLTDHARVERQTLPAQIARRGRIDSPETLHRRALTRARRRTHVWGREPEILAYLLGVGLHAVDQYPVEGYNLDIALPMYRVSVEVENATLTSVHRAKHHKRTKDLLDLGWSTIFVCAKSGRPFSAAAVGEYVIACLKDMCRDEAPRRGYWVVRGDGHEVSPTGLDLQGLPRIRRASPGHE